MNNESGSPITKPGGHFLQKVVLRGKSVMCAGWSEEDCSVSHDSIQTGEATGSAEVSKASVVTWAPRGTEMQRQWGWPQSKRRAKARYEDGTGQNQ